MCPSRLTKKPVPEVNSAFAEGLLGAGGATGALVTAGFGARGGCAASRLGVRITGGVVNAAPVIAAQSELEARTATRSPLMTPLALSQNIEKPRIPAPSSW